MAAAAFALLIATLANTVSTDVEVLSWAFGVTFWATLALRMGSQGATTVLGMNTYVFNFGRTTEDNCLNVDKPTLKTMCRAIGYLWLACKNSTTFGTGDPTSAGKVNMSLIFSSKKRLPSDIEPPQLFDGNLPDVYNPGGTTFMEGYMSSIDVECTDVIPNLDQRLVKAGNLIVAVTRDSVSLSDQLSSEVRIPLGTDAGGQGQALWIGVANTSAQQGVYDAPFSDAITYATLGMNVTQVPVVINS